MLSCCFDPKAWAVLVLWNEKEKQNEWNREAKAWKHLGINLISIIISLDMK